MLLLPARLKFLLTLGLFLFAPLAAAQTVTHDVLIDQDRNAATGCQATPAGAPAFGGFERRLRAEVDTSSHIVNAVTLSQCDGGTFQNATNVAGPYPVALNQGSNGSDSIELAIGRSAIAGNGQPAVQVVLVGDNGSGSDLLATTNGSGSGAPILISLPIYIPVLTIGGLVLLIALVLLLAWQAHRRLVQVSLVGMLALVAVTAWAMHFAADGNLSDWTGKSPRANDPAGDATDGSAAIDLRAAFIALEDDTLYFRIDVTDIQNQPPATQDDSYSTDEDTALNVAAPGVLGNDSDAEGDPISAAVDTPPANAQAFTLNADGSFDYTPADDFNGTDTFTYVANDGMADSAPATVSITVNPVNDAPQATDDIATTDEDTAVIIDVLTNDSDVDGSLDPATVSIGTAPTDGSTSIDTTTGEITYTPAADFFGTDSFDYEACDDGTPTPAECVSATVTVTIDAVNDAPSFTGGGDVTVDEDSGAYDQPWASAISAGPANEAGQTMTFNITANDNAVLFTAGPTIDPATGNLGFTPAADAGGTANITVELQDDGGTVNGGVDSSTPVSFAINLTTVNDPPQATDDADTTDEDNAVTIDVLANDSDVDGNLDPATASISAAPADGGTSINASTGEITYTPDADFFGSDSFDYEVCDDGTPLPAECATATVTITVEAVNDAPSFTGGGDVTVDEDSSTYDQPWASAISAGPANEAGQTLTFNITGNDNTGLFAAGPAIDPTTGNLSFTPAADANGTANITVELHDDGGTANGGDDTSAPVSFVISVTAVNDAPSFTSGGDVTVLEDSGSFSQAWAGNISPGPADEAGQALTFTITGNDNAGLFAAGPSLDASGNLSFTPDTDAFGTANITVELNDDGGTANGGADTSAPVTFAINVSGVNDAPSFTGDGDVTVLEDAGAVSQLWASDISAGPTNEDGQTLTFNITGNDNAALFAAGPAIDAAGNLSFTPAADANGTANITVELQDDGGTANGGVDTSAPVSFVISVTAINDAPSFTSGGDVTVLEDSGSFSQAWAGNLSPGPADEAGQALTFTITGNDNAGLFAAGPSLDASGNLSFTPDTDAFGTANITVELSDDGGTANGGADTSAPVTFAINVSGVNDAPSFTGDGDVTVLEDAGAISQLWASDISAGPTNEAGQTLTFNITGNDNTGLFAAGPAIDPTTGNLSFTPTDDANGVANITVELQDDGGTANGGDDTSAPDSFVITVEPVNDPPVVNAPGPFNVTGNVRIQVPDGVDDLLSDVSDLADGSVAEPFFINSFDATSTNGGTIAVDTGNGNFSYDPPAGFEGTDSFDYEVCDNGEPGSACTTATVSLNVTDMVWFVDPAASAGGDGRLTSPFNDIDALDAVNDGTGNNPAGGDPIFLYSGTHDGQLTLLDNQRVFGQGASASLAVMTGITLPTYSDNFPTTGGTLPQWTATNATALTLASGNTLRGFEIGNTGSGTDIAGSTFGTLTVSELTLSGTGQALNLSGGTLANGAGTPGFVGISSSSGSRNISLVNVAGTPTLGTGALSGATGQAFYVDGGSGSFSYPGSISNAASRVVEVRNRTTGAVTLSGSLTSNAGGTGILVTSNSGGTVTFSGASKTLSTGTANAVTLSSNTGATVAFSNGGLDIDTTSGTGFAASGGGTLTVEGAGNSVTTSTGTGVDIANTTIGGNGVTFDSISVDGAANGIVLNNTGTSGGFTVTGDGTSNQNASGGVVQNTTADAVMLTSANNVALYQMQVSSIGRHGVSGASVNNFTMEHSTFSNVGDANDENVMEFRAGSGSGASAITGLLRLNNVDISQFHDTGLLVYNESGNVDIDIDDCDFTDNDDTVGTDAIFVETKGTAGVTLNINGGTFDNVESDVLLFQGGGSGTNDVTLTGMTSTNGGGPDDFPNGGGISISVDSGASVTFDVRGNSFFDTPADPLLLAAPVGAGGGTLEGRIGGPNAGDGNIFSESDLGDGSQLTLEGPSSNFVILIQGNEFGTGASGLGDDGIQILHRDSNGALDLTIEDNTFANTVSEAVRFFSDEDTAIGAGNPTSRFRLANNAMSNIDTDNNENEIEFRTSDTAASCYHAISNDDGAGGSPGVVNFSIAGTSTAEITQSSLGDFSSDNFGATVVGDTPAFDAACTNPALPAN